ncbi:MAG TPA: DUF1634 domain-containing protein [Caulobacteraceae bacterium]|jgi:uncharacterized membrane protein
MTISAPAIVDRLNGRLAWLLGVGTWASCGLIVTGMILSVSGAGSRGAGAQFVSAGIVLLIALPALRVAMMGVWFLLSRDLDFALIAAFVLAIILVSALLGAGAAVAVGPRTRGAHGAQLARSFTSSTKATAAGQGG